MRVHVLRMMVGLLAIGVATAGCGDDEDPVVLNENQEDPEENQNNQNNQNNQTEDEAVWVPEFFEDSENMDDEPVLTVIADSSDNIASPNDLEFHPFDERDDELWILNEDSTSTGGSTVTLFAAGTDQQESEWIRDGNAWHFMALPTSLAFGDNGHWATGAGVQDSNHDGGSYSGPSLWSSDFDIYGEVGDPPTQDVNGSHLDMLHGSPFSMGIAHEVDNAYWVYDGYNGHMVRYDFVEPHPPGGWDHSNGLIHRYKEVEIERHESLPSHLIVDKSSGWLYINDTGNQRILRLDTESGTKLTDLGPRNEPIEEHWEMHEVEWEVFAEDALVDPTGIALNDDRLFVTDHGTGDLIAYDVDSGDEMDRVHVGDGIRGITIGPDEKVWLADYDQNQVLRLDPQ